MVMNMPKIDVMYAFIAVDKEPNDEGVVAAFLNGAWMPLVGADMKRVESLKLLAQNIAKATGKKITLAKFQAREDVEVIS